MPCNNAITIFSLTGTYDKALERSKRAEETSNIDSDLEGLKRRPTRKPAKYDFSEEEEADGLTLHFTYLCYVAYNNFYTQ